MRFILQAGHLDALLILLKGYSIAVRSYAKRWCLEYRMAQGLFIVEIRIGHTARVSINDHRVYDHTRKSAAKKQDEQVTGGKRRTQYTKPVG